MTATVHTLEMTSEQADEQLIQRLEAFLKLARSGAVHQAFIVLELENEQYRVSSMLCGNEDHVVKFLDRAMDAIEQLIEIETGEEAPEPVKLNG